MGRERNNREGRKREDEPVKSKQKVSIVIVLVMLVMLLTSPVTGAQEPPNTMRIGVTVEVDSLSPLISYSQIGYEVFQLLYDSPSK